MNGIRLLGAIAALFAAALLLLPAIRVAQHRLPVRRAIGLWVSGTGFLLLAIAAFSAGSAAARPLVPLGIAAAVIGNIMQRKMG